MGMELQDAAALQELSHRNELTQLYGLLPP